MTKAVQEVLARINAGELGPEVCERCGSRNRTDNGHCAPCEDIRKLATASKPCLRCGTAERGSNGQCKECKRRYQRARNATPEGKAHRRSYERSERGRATRARERSSEEYKAKRRVSRKTQVNKEKNLAYCRRSEIRMRRYARRYGVSPAALVALYEAQRGKCAVCGDPLKPGRGTHIDHDHNTGQLRGLLCRSCNLAEGYLRGSALRARKLAAYLERCAPLLRLTTHPADSLRIGA